MFIHLGGDCMVKSIDVIMIINAENNNKVQTMIESIQNSRVKKDLYKIDEDNIKSMIITDNKIYFSPISSQTLKKRASFISEL